MKRFGWFRGFAPHAVLCWVLLLPGLAEASGPESADSAADPGLALERLNGVWELDWERSDSFEPVMDVLEVPWLLRRLAGLISVQIAIEVKPPTCETCPPTMHVAQKNPVRNSERTVELDGVARPATDPLGNESLDRFSWSPEIGMEMMRERTLDSGRSARIRERRRVEDDLHTMVSTMTVWIDGVEEASVRRVLRKVEP